MKQRDIHSLAALLLIQLAAIALVDARGNFPVNDDWAYAQSVQWLLGEGRIRLSDWIGMNLLPQTLAGGAVATLFGFSFEALRHLTQVVSILAAFAAYAWFRSNGMEALDAFIATLAVIAFPAWPALANSYMTDLYGLALALGAATLFVKSIEEPRPAWILLATCFAILGVLQRQVVAVVPFAFMVAWFWQHRTPTWRSLLVGTLPLAATVVSEAAYQYYLLHGPGIPEAQQYLHGRLIADVLKTLSNDEGHRGWVGANVATMGGYIGWFLFGWALWCGTDRRASNWHWGVLALLALVAALLVVNDWVPPFRDDQMVDRMGIGPFTLHDGVPRWLAPMDHTSGVFWKVVGVGAAFGIVALLALCIRAGMGFLGRGRRIGSIEMFSIALLVAYLGPFVVTDYIDRYLLYPLPFLFVLWMRLFGRRPEGRGGLERGVAIAWIALSIGIGAIATRDYFTWNRARWDLIGHAERLGATPETLDGGFEYDGLMRYEIKPRSRYPGKSWWWVKDDVYAVTFGPRAGYEVVVEKPLRTVFPRSPKALYLLRRKAA